MISGNPLLGAYVTDLEVKLGIEDGSEDKMSFITVEKDIDFIGAQTANTIVTYYLWFKNDY